MNDIEQALRTEFRDAEYSEGYAESFLNAFIATQIKVIREQRNLTQAQLAERIGTTQAGISRCEDVNYSSWSIRTLTKLARAFQVRLRVSFESFGSLAREASQFNRETLGRPSREDDPELYETQDEIPMYMRDLSFPELDANNVVQIDSNSAWKKPQPSIELPEAQKQLGGYDAVSGGR